MNQTAVNVSPALHDGRIRVSMVVYELSCPACKRVMRGPFVRIGAVVDCEGCRRRFVVHADLIRRQVNNATGEALQRLYAEFACPAAPMPHLTARNGANGSNGHTEPAGHATTAATATSAPEPRPAVPAAAPEDDAAASVASLAAEFRRQRRRMRTVRNRNRKRQMLAGVAMAVAIALLIAVLILLSQADGPDTTGGEGVQSAVSTSE